VIEYWKLYAWRVPVTWELTNKMLALTVSKHEPFGNRTPGRLISAAVKKFAGLVRMAPAPDHAAWAVTNLTMASRRMAASIACSPAWAA